MGSTSDINEAIKFNLTQIYTLDDYSGNYKISFSQHPYDLMYLLDELPENSKVYGGGFYNDDETTEWVLEQVKKFENKYRIRNSKTGLILSMSEPYYSRERFPFSMRYETGIEGNYFEITQHSNGYYIKNIGSDKYLTKGSISEKTRVAQSQNPQELYLFPIN